jgi:hypothetical protein
MMPATMSMGGPDQDYEAESDANKLMAAHEVVSDDKRHKAAVLHIKKKQAAHQEIIDNHDTALQTAAKGLKKVFGGEDAEDEQDEENEKAVKGKSKPGVKKAGQDTEARGEKNEGEKEDEEREDAGATE